MVGYTDDFELFWRSYPPRFNESRSVYVRADKQGAFDEWQKLVADEKIAALNAVQREKASKYTPDARKWLKHKRWEDVIAPLREFDRPPPKEIQVMIDKLTNSGLKDVPSVKLSHREVNSRRNEARRKLGI